MGSWTIYSKNGVAKAEVKELELRDEWMAECYVTVSVKSATPIDFAVGDYIDYRGERYTIQYDPTELKKASSGSYGEGFTYDNIKIVGPQDDIVRCDFKDIVLNDNEIHYTALATFPFYCETVDDLLDRLQANLEDLYPGEWIIIGLNTVRNAQRGTLVGRKTAFENAYRRWIDPSLTPNTTPYGKQNVAETVDNINCWTASAKIHDDFGLNFIVRGKVMIVGTVGVFTNNTFRYGKGNGLYEIEKIGDPEQQIITRLRAYGSDTNIPPHYYAAINMMPYGTVVESSTTGEFELDVDFDENYYYHEFTSGETDVIINIGGTSYNAKAYMNDEDGNTMIRVSTSVSVTSGMKVYITDGVRRDMWPSDSKDYAQGALPDNMAVSRLMLPGFPNNSLYDWVKAHRDTGTTYNDTTGLATYKGHTAYFSKDPLRPYIDSLTKDSYGIRPANINFDGREDYDDIHPTIEGMTHNGSRIDVVYAAEQIEDNGVYDSGEIPNFTITLPNLGFNLSEVYEDGASIDMKDGMCGGRSFALAARPTQDAAGRWICECKRSYDDILNLYFPYEDFQIANGDHYVLIGIQMPTAYIDAASLRLLDASLEALAKNDVPRITYQPRIDELFMARQHDSAVANNGVSLHDTLKAGDVFVFEDTDMGIDASIIIDVLTIKENGNNGIPTYEVTLRDEKQVGTIQKVQNKIDDILNNGLGGLSTRQIQSLINSYGSSLFLSKLYNDSAQGFIKFLKGHQIGQRFTTGLLGEGGVFRTEEDGTTYIEADKLYIRMKAYFDTVEVREYIHSGGNRVASPADCRVIRVEWIDSNGNVLEQTDANLSNAVKFRCYFRGSDGEKTITNDFVVGDQAYCHITNMESNDSLYQHHYWRLVIGKDAEVNENGEHYIDLSNTNSNTISGVSYAGYQAGSDVPVPQDSIVQLGNVNDNTRRGAVVEFVSGADSPSYQIFQNIGKPVGSTIAQKRNSQYSLTGKNFIGIGYSTQTGRAYMNVFGDAYIGDPDGSTYIEYKQVGRGGVPEMNIKANVTFTSPDTHQDTTLEDFASAVVSGLESLQDQVDGNIDSFFYNYAPVSVDAHGAPTSKTPLNVVPYSEWDTTEKKRAHLGDTFTNNVTGYCWRFTWDETHQAFEWTLIEDSAVITALQNASRAQETADGKRRTFLVQPTPPYDAGDLWVNATFPSGNEETDESQHKYYNDVLKCIRGDNGSFSISDWALASKYTDDSALNDFKANQYVIALTNGTITADILAAQNTANSAAEAAGALDSIKQALNGGTLIDGGLVLSSLIGLRDQNSTMWSGLNGAYSSSAYGGGLAFWTGGGMVDRRNPVTGQYDVSGGAKIGMRFDGSGYLADGAIAWDSTGVTNLSVSRVSASHIDLGGSNVATESWVSQNFITVSFFDRLFRAYFGNNTVSPNAPSSTQIDSIKARYSIWSEGDVSALGRGSGGGGGGGIVLNEPLASINSAGLANHPSAAGQTIVWNGSTWQYGSAGGGIDMPAVWSALGAATNEQINASHLTNVLSNYLPIAGGTLTGELITASPITINGYGGRTFGITPTNAGHNGDNVDVGWNWTDKDGAGAFFRSSDANSNPGSFGFYARNSAGTTCQLIGTPAGSLTWGGNELLTSADVGNFVTLDTAQTVTGAKTFSSTITLSNASASYTISAKDATSASRNFLKIDYTMNSDTGVQTASMTLNSYGNLTTVFAPANTEGYQRLKLGSSNKLNAANNMYGSIRLQGRRDSSNPSGTVYYGDINPDVLSANRTWTLPNKSGTIALADDFGDLFTALTSTNATNLSVTIGGTTKTLTDVYAYQSKNVRPLNMAEGDDYDTLSGYTLTRGCFVAMNYNSLTTNDVTLDDLGLYDTLVSFGRGYRTIQFKGNAYGTAHLRYRRVVTPSSGVYAFSEWKDIAFTDGNIATATALATARTLWGQSFDGTSDVTGTITVGNGDVVLNNNKHIYFKDAGGTNRDVLEYSTSGNLHLGYGTASAESNTYINGYAVYLRYGTARSYGLMLNSSGNVGIGTTTPEYKLHVSGVSAAQSFRSTVETGTAPLVVASSTLVTNLNADRLDGKHASDFATASDVTTLQGYFDASGSARNALRLTTVSKTAWGQTYWTANGVPTNISGDMSSVGSITLTNNSRISNATGSGGSLYIGRSDDAGWVKMSDMCSRQGDSYWKITSSGDVTATNIFSIGDVSGMSDARKKTIIKHLTLDVRRIAEMPIVRFQWKDRRDNSLQVGTLAQSWLPLLPEIVTHSNDDVYGVKYGVGAMCIGISNSREIVGILNEIAAILNEVKSHDKRLTLLEKENRELREEIDRIKAA